MIMALGSDHAGFELKEAIKSYLAGSGIQVVDVGTTSTLSVDYPDYARKAADVILAGAADLGILVCATGVGVCIAANKIHGIRAAAAWSPEIARLSRQHNDANVLCLAGRFMEKDFALELVLAWLESSYEGGRHQRRLELISGLERQTP